VLWFIPFQAVPAIKPQKEKFCICAVLEKVKKYPFSVMQTTCNPRPPAWVTPSRDPLPEAHERPGTFSTVARPRPFSGFVACRPDLSKISKGARGLSPSSKSKDTTPQRNKQYNITRKMQIELILKDFEPISKTLHLQKDSNILY
jgi:hypothetical protein